MFKTNFLAFIAVALVISTCTSLSNNKQREIDQKVEKILIQMTLEEKAGQMTQPKAKNYTPLLILRWFSFLRARCGMDM